MLLIEREIEIPFQNKESLLSYFRKSISKVLGENEVPVRFAVTETNNDHFKCEIGVVVGENNLLLNKSKVLFNFEARKYENKNKFNALMLVPTGIGAEIGGHAGDAAPVARLLASACDTLITHPNVVNASDINEMPSNGLYVEGSVITDLLMGNCGLNPTKANRVILLIDKHKDDRIASSTINAISAARATLGLNCPVVVEVDPPMLRKTTQRQL